MDDIEVVEVPDALEKVLLKEGDFLFPEGFPAVPPPLDQRFQRSTPDQLHFYEQIQVGFVKGIELYYVFVVHRLQYFRFLGKGPQFGAAHR